MARYTGPVCRLCRRETDQAVFEGRALFLAEVPGFRGGAPTVSSRAYPPGEHGRDRMRQGSEYLAQLREKQKARRIYGVFEKQFRNLYEEADRHCRASPARTCCACSSSGSTTWPSAPAGVPAATQSRQFVRHGHMTGERQARRPFRATGSARVTSLHAQAPVVARDLIVVRRNMDTLDRQRPRRGWKSADERLREVSVLNPPAARPHRRAGARVSSSSSFYSK